MFLVGRAAEYADRIDPVVFIYASFLAVGSPVILYMILAFWIKMKNYVFNRRTSVWDL